MGAVVEPSGADALEQALAAADIRADAGDAAFRLEADDGRYTIHLRRVVYVKRLTRESRLGFSSSA